MAQDKTRLPEGTDRIIPGAAQSTGGEAALIEPGPAKGGPKGAQASGDDQTGKTERIMDKVKSGKDKVAVQAADKTRDFVGQGLGRSGEALGNVSRLVGDTAEGLDERLGKEYGDYARRAASAIDDVARKLSTKDPDELIDDTRAFVRKSPGVALAGAAIVGFALARLVKSGFDIDRDDGDDGRTPGAGGRTTGTGR